MTPAVDRSDMALFVEVLFRYCDDGGYVSLRTFRDDIDGVWRPDLWATPQVNGSLSTVINAALKLAEAAAGAPVPVVFAPPVATFKSAKGAAEKDIAAGPALSVECDDNPERAREILENTLGPATVAVASGGLWTDPESGEKQDKVHLHWRLTEPTRDLPNHIKLKEARRFATMLVGADASAVPLVHPLRWPGSLHRKAEPRLARIVNLRPEIEIELDDALEALKDAVAALPPGENGRDPTAPGGGYTPEIGRQPSRFGAEAEALDIVSALAVIANKERNWKRWSDIGMAVWHASSGSSAGYAAFLAWSSKFDGVDPGKTRERWEHFAKHPPGAIGAGSLFHMARQAWPGWEKPSDQQRRRDNDPGEPPPHLDGPDRERSSHASSGRDTPGDKTDPRGGDGAASGPAVAVLLSAGTGSGPELPQPTPTPTSAQSFGPLPEPFSHEWLALQFSAEHHADWRFVALWGKWQQWAGTRWRNEDTLRAFELARRICRAESAACDNAKLAREVGRASAVAGVERLVRADRRHAMTFDQYDAQDWDFNQPQRKD